MRNKAKMLFIIPRPAITKFSKLYVRIDGPTLFTNHVQTVVQ